jgi:hypothetical protein
MKFRTTVRILWILAAATAAWALLSASYVYFAQAFDASWFAISVIVLLGLAATALWLAFVDGKSGPEAASSADTAAPASPMRARETSREVIYRTKSSAVTRTEVKLDGGAMTGYFITSGADTVPLFQVERQLDTTPIEAAAPDPLVVEQLLEKRKLQQNAEVIA